MGGTYKYRDIFARFIIMQEKPILARVIDTSQRIGDNHAFFRDQLTLHSTKNALHYFVF